MAVEEVARDLLRQLEERNCEIHESLERQVVAQQEIKEGKEEIKRLKQSKDTEEYWQEYWQERWRLDNSNLRDAVSEVKELEGVCRELLHQLEERNNELQKASQGQVVAEVELRESKEEIERLKQCEVRWQLQDSKIKAAECELEMLDTVCQQLFDQLKERDNEFQKASERQVTAELELSEIKEEIIMLRQSEEGCQVETSQPKGVDTEVKKLQAVCEDLLDQLDKRLKQTEEGWQLQDSKLKAAEDEVHKLKVICQDLLIQLEERNNDIQKATEGQAAAEMELRGAKEEIKRLVETEEGWILQAARLQAAESEVQKLEEVCRDLLQQLDRRNDELQNASESQILAEQELIKSKEDIRRLKQIEVAECSVCAFEFGEAEDKQRAYWRDCHHATVCFKCSKDIWESNSRTCPICRTPASSMPIPLSPKMYM